MATADYLLNSSYSFAVYSISNSYVYHLNDSFSKVDSNIISTTLYILWCFFFLKESWESYRERERPYLRNAMRLLLPA